MTFSHKSGFNLVIERLLISGREARGQLTMVYTFQSRYRAASHFRVNRIDMGRLSLSVSISLSSGFSFQDIAFFLCIDGIQVSFNLVIERLLISGEKETQETKPARTHVSISLSSGFSFQAARKLSGCFLLIMFQSRYRAASHFRWIATAECPTCQFPFQSRYRAASHFRSRSTRRSSLSASFNLVIERLLISGVLTKVGRLIVLVFQSRYRAASHFRSVGAVCNRASSEVSISLSSGFSFQVKAGETPSPGVFRFQSRYRAASHFRKMAMLFPP